MVANVKLPETLLEALRHFTPEVAAAYVDRIKWPDGPCCPKCGSVNVGRIASRNRLQCRERRCRKQFSLLTDTIFEATHLRLDQWVVGVWMIANCRNGVSSCEIARAIGCKQTSAWHLLHRVRHILAESNTEKLSGSVEMDATFVGGEWKNMKHGRRSELQAIGRMAGKVVVHAIKCRLTGEIRAGVVADQTSETLMGLVAQNVEPGSYVHTDAAMVYRDLGFNYRHSWVNHSAGEYGRGGKHGTHTNGCENFFNCLRRGLRGTYIRPSPEHLDQYVREACYRFNVRNETDWDRFDGAMRRIVGKRLTYSELTGGAVR